MQTLAHACGVSRMAVSLALRGHHGVSDKVRARIRKKAQEMGYRYDADLSKLTTYLAQRNRKQETRGEIPFAITHHPAEPSYEGHARWMNYLEGAAKQNGYRLERYDIEVNSTNRRSLERVWRNRGIQGVVFSHLYDPRHPPKMTWKDFSWVVIGRNFRNPTINRVDVDHRRGIHDCAKQLHQLGYERIGFFIPRSYDRSVDFICTGAARGYQSCLPVHRRIPILEDERVGNPNMKQKLIRDWLTHHKIDAVICPGEGTYHELCHLGLRIPQDLGFACWQLPDNNRHDLSGINCGYNSLGKVAVELLLSQIHHGVKGIPENPTLSLVAGNWHAGSTVRKSRKKVPLPPELR